MANRKKPASDRIDLEALEAGYRAVGPFAERLRQDLARELGHLLNAAGIALGFAIDHRIKTWDSIAEKLVRTSLRLGRIEELQDLVGLRIVLLFDRDVDTVRDLIKEHLQLIREYNTGERLKEDQFGYSSWHLIVRVPEAWTELPTMASLGELQAEIQVRTLAQHAWAAVSQALQYKQEESVPPQLRRSIYRVSALLETVDLEFERFLTEREQYRRSIEPTATADPLNVDSLEKLLDSLLPPQNKITVEPYSELLTKLADCGVTTSQQLVALNAPLARRATRGTTSPGT